MDEIIETGDDKTYWSIIDRTISKNILYGLDKDQLQEARNSQHARLSRGLLEKTAEYARANRISVDDFEWDLVPLTVSFLDSLQHSLVSYDNKNTEERFNYWRHKERPLHLIKTKKSPYMERSEIESAVGEYLNLPFRDERIDRLLVDILIALELYAYGDEIYNANDDMPWWYSSPYAHLKINPFWHFVKGQLFSAIVFLGSAAVAFFSGMRNWISDSLATGIATILVSIFLILFLLGLLFLPRFWRSTSKLKEKTYDPMIAMLNVYSGMISNGPISAIHILEAVKKAEDKHISWPAPLFALLDDIITRTRRF